MFKVFSDRGYIQYQNTKFSLKKENTIDFLEKKENQILELKKVLQTQKINASSSIEALKNNAYTEKDPEIVTVIENRIKILETIHLSQKDSIKKYDSQLENIEYAKEAYRRFNFIILRNEVTKKEEIVNSLNDDRVYVLLLNGYRFLNKKHYNAWKETGQPNLKEIKELLKQ